MKTYLIRFSAKGIKNIDKLTAVDFYNNSIARGKKINLSKKNLKGIFGINGAGKSAYIIAMDIYKRITTKNDYLVQDTIKNKLEKLINKKTKELFLETIFAVSTEHDDNKISEILKHTIIISQYYNDFKQRSYSIYEKLEKLVGTTINTNFDSIYSIKSGKLDVNPKLIDKNWFVNEYSNRLEQSTLSSFTINSLLKHQKTDLTKNRLLTYLYFVFFNALTTSVFIDADDVHEDFKIDDKIIKNYTNSINVYDRIKNMSISLKIDKNIIPAEKLTEYKAQVSKLKDFIQILKPNLRDIRVENKVDGDYLHCNKIFVYDDYEVDEEYESTGIKRIVKMFDYLNLAIKGNKVFIDELDANISGVFLDKLLDFFAQNGKGQLCFTSHNILSMNILKQYKNSITVFGETGMVVNVVKNGHYQPVNLFYEGFIEDSPFNINSFDFHRSFNLDLKENE